jgi:hypothetical protein
MESRVRQLTNCPFLHMLIHNLHDADGSRCTLTFEEPNQWLRATWHGFVDPVEAQRGASHYLDNAAAFQCPYLLNDNAALQGPWFDSVEWLERVWLLEARRMGLRYVAHVVQADRQADVISLNYPKHLVGAVELQIFERVADAEAWLRSCQGGAARPAAAVEREVQRQSWAAPGNGFAQAFES